MEMSEKDIKRFWSKVDIRGADECWLWKSDKYDGYGQFSASGISRKAHHFAWVIANGRTPRKGHHIAHKPLVCHNRACCNPSHLSEKTPKENSADREMDGTVARGERNGAYTRPEKVLCGERHGRAKLTKENVNQIRELRKQGLAQQVIAKMFGVGHAQVSRIEREKQWREKP